MDSFCQLYMGACSSIQTKGTKFQMNDVVEVPIENNYADVAKKYAAYLRAETWCIDVSNVQHRAFHGKSKRHVMPDHLVLSFESWATANKVFVVGDYSAFKAGLGSRLVSLLPKIVGSTFVPVCVTLFEPYPQILLSNTFAPYNPERITNQPMPAIFEEYLSRVFVNQQDREIVLDWCADIIQNPGRRPEWGVILRGDSGTGKSTVCELVKKALGGSHVWQRNQYKLALERFSEVLPNHLLVCFDDAKPNKDTYEDLKYVMSAKQLEVETKHVQQRQVRDVYARVLICTNRYRPFEFDATDRRFYVCQRNYIQGSKKESEDFFAEFYQWLRGREAAPYLYNFFMDRDLSHFRHDVTIQTADLRQLVGVANDELETVIREIANETPYFHNEHLLCRLAYHGHAIPTPARIAEVMKSLGFEHARRYVPGCHAKQIYVWQSSLAKRNRKLLSHEIHALQICDQREQQRHGLLDA
jgi:hypothetical protein